MKFADRVDHRRYIRIVQPRMHRKTQELPRGVFRHCEIAIDGQLVLQQDGETGAACQLSRW